MRWIGLAMLWLACNAEPRPGPTAAGPPSPAPAVRPSTIGSPPIQAPGALASVGSPATMAAPESSPGRPSPAHPAPPSETIAPGRVLEPGARLTVAVHDVDIAMLAVTEDGSVAVSADRQGGMRLWPSLDGLHEPVVVHAEMVAEQLAIARDGGDVVIAVAGSLGQVAVIRTTAAGEPISRVSIDLERSIVALHPSASGFVALRDDTTIAAIDLHGAWLATLTVRPGERITALASRHGRVFALVTAGSRVRARWIESDPFAWGSESAVLPIDPEQVVLAPDHERIAGWARNRKDLLIVRLSDGRILARSRPAPDFAGEVGAAPPLPEPPPAPAGGKMRVQREEPEEQPPRLLGFLADGTLALRFGTEASSALAWWNGRKGWTGGTRTFTLLGLGRHAPVVVDRQVISGAFATLALDTPGRARYLGFRVVNVTSAIRRDNDWLIADRDAIVAIDDQLRTRTRYRVLGDLQLERPPDTVILLDARHYIEADDGQAYLVELAHPGRRIPLFSSGNGISYEPTTRWLSIPGGADGSWLGRYDPKAGRFRETMRYQEPETLVLLDPSLHHGNVAWKLMASDLVATITEIRAIDVGAAQFRVGRRFERKIPRQLDRDDTSFDWLTADLARHHDSPDGSQVAIVVGGGRITLRDGDGGERWAVALPGVVGVAWGGPGELIAFGSGLARIDVATGALRERRCGWDFGLWTNIEIPSAGARLCEAP